MVGCGYLLIALFGFQMAASFLCGDSEWSDVASAGVLAVAAATGSVVFSFFLIVTVKKLSSRAEAMRPADDRSVGSPTQPSHPWRPVCGSLALFCSAALSAVSFLPVVPVASAIKLFLLLMILAVGFQERSGAETFSSRTPHRQAPPSYLARSPRGRYGGNLVLLCRIRAVSEI
jgi:hypothetical protein